MGCLVISYSSNDKAVKGTVLLLSHKVQWQNKPCLDLLLSPFQNAAEDPVSDVAEGTPNLVPHPGHVMLGWSAGAARPMPQAGGLRSRPSVVNFGFSGGFSARLVDGSHLLHPRMVFPLRPEGLCPHLLCL